MRCRHIGGVGHYHIIPVCIRLQRDADISGEGCAGLVMQRSDCLSHRRGREMTQHQRLSLQRHFSVLTKFAHVESRLSGRKRQREVVF